MSLGDVVRPGIRSLIRCQVRADRNRRTTISANDFRLRLYRAREPLAGCWYFFLVTPCRIRTRRNSKKSIPYRCARPTCRISISVDAPCYYPIVFVSRQKAPPRVPETGGGNGPATGKGPVERRMGKGRGGGVWKIKEFCEFDDGNDFRQVTAAGLGAYTWRSLFGVGGGEGGGRGRSRKRRLILMEPADARCCVTPGGIRSILLAALWLMNGWSRTHVYKTRIQAPSLPHAKPYPFMASRSYIERGAVGRVFFFLFTPFYFSFIFRLQRAIDLLCRLSCTHGSATVLSKRSDKYVR